MICQQRSSAIREKACSGGSAWILRYLASILGSRSRKAASRRKPPAAALLLGQQPQGRPLLRGGLEGGLDEVVRQGLVPAGQPAGVPEQIAGMSRETPGQFLRLVR